MATPALRLADIADGVQESSVHDLNVLGSEGTETREALRAAVAQLRAYAAEKEEELRQAARLGLRLVHEREESMHEFAQEKKALAARVDALLQNRAVLERKVEELEDERDELSDAHRRITHELSRGAVRRDTMHAEFEEEEERLRGRMADLHAGLQQERARAREAREQARTVQSSAETVHGALYETQNDLVEAREQIKALTTQLRVMADLKRERENELIEVQRKHKAVRESLEPEKERLQQMCFTLTKETHMLQTLLEDERAKVVAAQTVIEEQELMFSQHLVEAMPSLATEISAELQRGVGLFDNWVDSDESEESEDSESEDSESDGDDNGDSASSRRVSVLSVCEGDSFSIEPDEELQEETRRLQEELEARDEEMRKMEEATAAATEAREAKHREAEEAAQALQAELAAKEAQLRELEEAKKVAEAKAEQAEESKAEQVERAARAETLAREREAAEGEAQRLHEQLRAREEELRVMEQEQAVAVARAEAAEEAKHREAEEAAQALQAELAAKEAQLHELEEAKTAAEAKAQQAEVSVAEQAERVAMAEEAEKKRQTAEEETQRLHEQLRAREEELRVMEQEQAVAVARAEAAEEAKHREAEEAAQALQAELAAKEAQLRTLEEAKAAAETKAQQAEVSVAEQAERVAMAEEAEKKRQTAEEEAQRLHEQLRAREEELRALEKTKSQEHRLREELAATEREMAALRAKGVPAPEEADKPKSKKKKKAVKPTKKTKKGSKKKVKDSPYANFSLRPGKGGKLSMDSATSSAAASPASVASASPAASPQAHKAKKTPKRAKRMSPAFSRTVTNFTDISPGGTPDQPKFMSYAARVSRELADNDANAGDNERDTPQALDDVESSFLNELEQQEAREQEEGTKRKRRQSSGKAKKASKRTAEARALDTLRRFNTIKRDVQRKYHTMSNKDFKEALKLQKRDSTGLSVVETVERSVSPQRPAARASTSVSVSPGTPPPPAAVKTPLTQERQRALTNILADVPATPDDPAAPAVLAAGDDVAADGVRHDAMREFFYLTCMCVRLGKAVSETACKLSNAALYEKCLDDAVPLHQWHEWIGEQIDAEMEGNAPGRGETANPMSIFTVTTPSHETVDSGKKPYTTYCVRVRSKGGVEWELHARYRQFLELHRTLQKVHKVPLPAFPPRKLLGSMDVETIKDRQRKLGLYLQDLTHETQFHPTRELDQFLHLNDLLRAVTNTDMPLVYYLVSRGYDVNAVDGKGCTPLHYAASLGMEGAVRLFVERKARVNAQDELGSTPLIFAASMGRGSSIALLARSGAALDHADSLGLTALHYAVIMGNLSACKYLLQAGASPAVADHFAATPLHVAASRGDKDAVQMLVDHEAPLNVYDVLGFPPVRLAVSFKHMDIAHLLMERGARNSSQPVPVEGLTVRDAWKHYYSQMGFTPMHKKDNIRAQQMAQYASMVREAIAANADSKAKEEA